jgi:hypothetical protein
MCPLSFPTNPDNNNLEPWQLADIDLAIFAEVVEILKARDDFDEAALHDYVADSRTLVDLPDVISVEWLHKTAGDVADAFLVWAAGGRQS